jgi:putative FmdB family regulatory protein
MVSGPVRSEGPDDDSREVRTAYEFVCEKCRKPFEPIMTMSEREKAAPTCPRCGGTEVAPQLGGFMAQTSKKR